LLLRVVVDRSQLCLLLLLLLLLVCLFAGLLVCLFASVCLCFDLAMAESRFGGSSDKALQLRGTLAAPNKGGCTAMIACASCSSH